MKFWKFQSSINCLYLLIYVMWFCECFRLDMKLSKVGNQTNSQDPQAVCSRVFVGNLNTFQCSKTDLERMFQRYGRLAGKFFFRFSFTFVPPPRLTFNSLQTCKLWMHIAHVYATQYNQTFKYLRYRGPWWLNITKQTTIDEKMKFYVLWKFELFPNRRVPSAAPVWCSQGHTSNPRSDSSDLGDRLR